MTISHTENQTKSNNIITLASWMAGCFSNQKQASSNRVLYAHIYIYFRPLPYQFFSGIGFYSEQVYDYDLWSPYRQGVHQLIDKGDHIYIENYGLKDPILYAGAARELDILHTITPENIERRYNCSMVFKRDGEKFLGSVEPGNKCLINKRGCETYLVSEVELTEQTWVSLDRGMDVNTHEQVWGSKAGHLKFEKQTSFADELPFKN
ncbi:MAG: chorismate-binding protein [Okeania sp. SIO2C9]|uniref:chromophore lyase CpcT/CpeT n=1 Tax=Okeania sp. SIO2C9 TaxID=2607791 RepID=UPI0013C17732|nr:chromophore lyase CpcT/CpeT [Okeania sp. SIO2C9]NEQ74521.1 chorismate-binding protein [Okeania sp. SIO2C9]